MRARWDQGLAIALVLSLLGLFTLRTISSPDIGFHLKAGNHVLSGNGWPRADPFTFTVNDRAYVDTSWGYQVMLAAVERVSGSAGMIVLHVLLVIGLFTLVLLAARLRAGEASPAAALLLLGGLAAEPRFEVRPEILSYTFLAALLYLLQRRAEGARTPLWLLPPLFLVWANSHSLFVLGWAAVACFVVGISFRERRLDRELALWGAASVAVTLINPYGWRALAFPFTLITRMQGENVFRHEIGEFESPLGLALSEQFGFYVVPTLCFFLFALLALLSLVGLWRQRRFSCLLLACLFLPLSLAMVRNVPLAVVACLPGTLWGLSFSSRRGEGLRVALSVGLVVLTLALGLRVYNDAYYISSRRLERFGTGWNRLTLPVDAVAHAERVGLRGPILNHLNFGGYLMWTRPEPVFIDGRLEVMGEEFFLYYRGCLSSKPRLEACVDRYGIRAIVFPYRLRPRLVEFLSRDPDWRLVYFDHLAALFAREGPGVDELMDARSRQVGTTASGAAVEVASLPGLGGAARPSRARRWLRGFVLRQSYPSDLYARGLFHFMRGDAARGAERFAEAIEESGGAYYEIYTSLGSTLFVLGRLEPARDCYRIALRELPSYLGRRRRHAQERLDEIESRLGSAAPLQGAVGP